MDLVPILCLISAAIGLAVGGYFAVAARFVRIGLLLVVLALLAHLVYFDQLYPYLSATLAVPSGLLGLALGSLIRSSAERARVARD